MKPIFKFLPHESRFVALQEASQITGVAYPSLITANRAGRLSLTKSEDGLLYVDVVDLIIYMIKGAPKKRRWKPTNVPLSKVSTDSKLQSRTDANGTIVAKLEHHFRAGGTVDPVWVMDDGSRLYLVDGHRRRKAALQAERQKIAAVTVQLPFSYASVISRLVNRRHGENLSENDQRGVVAKFLEENPNVAAALEKGELSQAALSQALDIPAATVSRAIRDRRSPEEIQVVPTQSVLLELHTLLGHLTESRLSSEDIAVGIVVLRSAGEALKSNLSTSQIRAAKTAAVNGVGEIAGLLPRQLKQLLDRRGGDRRRNGK